MTIICATLVLALHTHVSAEIYKWTDENGKTVYGDKPLSKEEAAKIKIDKAPTQGRQTQQHRRKRERR